MPGARSQVFNSLGGVVVNMYPLLHCHTHSFLFCHCYVMFKEVVVNIVFFHNSNGKLTFHTMFGTQNDSQ